MRDRLKALRQHFQTLLPIEEGGSNRPIGLTPLDAGHARRSSARAQHPGWLAPRPMERSFERFASSRCAAPGVVPEAT